MILPAGIFAAVNPTRKLNRWLGPGEGAVLIEGIRDIKRSAIFIKEQSSACVESVIIVHNVHMTLHVRV